MYIIKSKLAANDGFVIVKDENYKIYFENINIQNSILKASNGIKIEDLENSLNIESETLVVDEIIIQQRPMALKLKI